MNRIEKIPVPVVPTMLSLLTLSNVYGGLGYTAFRYTSMMIGTVFLLVYLLKIIMFNETFRKEYSGMVPSSLYAGFTMCLMVLGSFFHEMGFSFGKPVWIAAVFVHLIHLVIFILRFIVLKRSWETTMPCWFVTLNGIMVSCVTGGAMDFKWLLVPITYYGIAIYLCCLPFMIYRLLKKPIPKGTFHTQAILLAPVSLCIVSVINVLDSKPAGLMYLLLALYLLTILFIVCMLPKFFSFKFYPGYAGLTFPMAIGIVACNKAAVYFGETLGNSALAIFLQQLSGFLVFFTSMLVGYVLLKFTAMMFNVKDAE